MSLATDRFEPDDALQAFHDNCQLVTIRAAKCVQLDFWAGNSLEFDCPPTFCHFKFHISPSSLVGEITSGASGGVVLLLARSGVVNEGFGAGTFCDRHVLI